MVGSATGEFGAQVGQRAVVADASPQVPAVGGEVAELGGEGIDRGHGELVRPVVENPACPDGGGVLVEYDLLALGEQSGLE